ncbi:MAG: hypothetical protein NVS9B14_07170 [Candidatus Acidiferrum sp.]
MMDSDAMEYMAAMSPEGVTAHGSPDGPLQFDRLEAALGAIFSIGSSRGVHRRGEVMSFGIYAIGFGILICGLVYGAYLAHVPVHWIVVGTIVLLGIGILSGVKATRQKDPVG